jgi:hypothetical protein
LAPPSELSSDEAAAAVFRRTVATVAPNHFQPEDLPLLCAYARAVVLERRAGEQVAAIVNAGKVPSQWLGVYACATKTMLALSVRLRSAPGAREQ